MMLFLFSFIHFQPISLVVLYGLSHSLWLTGQSPFSDPVPLSVGINAISTEARAVADANVHTKKSVKQSRPSPPNSPPPNQAKPGGGLDSDSFLQACQHPTESLTAIVPVRNPVFTTQAHPSFWFYVPDSSNDILAGEFSLLSSDEKTRIYSTRFTLPQVPGVVSIELPNTLETTLVEGEAYHWYFKLYCAGNLSNRADLNVNGWIQRAALSSEQLLSDGASTSDIWYDTVTDVAHNLRVRPEDSDYKKRWAMILQEANLGELSNTTILGPVNVPEQ